MTDTTDRVWFELEVSPDKATNERRAQKLSTVLKYLGFAPRGEDAVWWNERRKCYCITMDEAGGFLDMEDKGQWFALDYFARIASPPAPVAVDENIASI